MINIKSIKHTARLSAGHTLLEVLIGIVIFALGILALAQLQGNLGKSSTDSNARTVAANLAEEIMERARSFRQVTAATGVDAFEDLVPGISTSTETRGGIEYSITQTVTDYWYDTGATSLTKDQFVTPKPLSRTNAANADLKLVELTVNWGGTGTDTQAFQIDGSQYTQGLGTGSIVLTDLISSIPTIATGKVVLNSTTSDLYGPPVNYNPGQNPDIVSIQLGTNRFKESTTPLPNVIRSDELVETTFDVVTYSQSDAGATFLRREEFRALSCECTLRASTSATEGGRRPTVWNGSDYDEGEFIAKSYGESASNQQSPFCDICCRDHHDGGSGSEDLANDPGRSKYDPFKGSSEYWTADDGVTALIGSHKHYKRSNTGDLTLAGIGDNYVAACRLVRKDGFWRVAQDLRQEGFNGFPSTYLDETSEVSQYSGYVTGSVSTFASAATDGYESAPPTLTLPINMSPSLTFPASTTATATTMSPTVRPEQQLRSRGIYLDYMTDELRDILICFAAGGTGTTCGAPGANSALEVIPFYDVQLTWLARWNESPLNIPIDTTNDAVANNNTHSRGMAKLTGGFGNSQITSTVHKGNLGLTATDPIDPDDGSILSLKSYVLHALALTSTTPPPSSGYQVSGSITSAVNGMNASDAIITATDAICDRTTNGFNCIVLFGATNPRLTVSHYFKRNRTLLACSTTLVQDGPPSHTSDTNAANNWTRFDLPFSNLPNADIIIKEGSCTP